MGFIFCIFDTSLMNMKSFFKYWSFTFLLGVLSLQNTSYSQSINRNELGFYQVKNYSTNDYLALPQTWGVMQDDRGIIYVCNGEGVLEFDGTSWRKITLDNGLAVKSLAIDNKGRIYVGAYNDLGFLSSIPIVTEKTK